MIEADEDFWDGLKEDPIARSFQDKPLWWYTTADGI
jgi:hypothetical protein